MNLKQARNALKKRLFGLKTSESEFLQAQLQGLNMLKDARDTFRPYKSFVQIRRDYLQFLHGLGNLLRGVGFAGLSLLMIGILLPTLMFQPKSVTQLLRDTFYIGCRSVAALVRGVTQCLTAPLALLRIPFRYLVFGYKAEKFEARESIQKLVQKARAIDNDDANAVQSMRDVLDELYRKSVHQDCERMQQSEKFKVSAKRIGSDFERINFSSPYPNLNDTPAGHRCDYNAAFFFNGETSGKITEKERKLVDTRLQFFDVDQKDMTRADAILTEYCREAARF